MSSGGNVLGGKCHGGECPGGGGMPQGERPGGGEDQGGKVLESCRPLYMYIYCIDEMRTCRICLY